MQCIFEDIAPFAPINIVPKSTMHFNIAINKNISALRKIENIQGIQKGQSAGTAKII
jgi:hypothetical protein